MCNAHCTIKGLRESARDKRLQQLTGWSWDTRVERWEEGFRQLLAYVDEHGHARVPVAYKVGHFNLDGMRGWGPAHM